VHINVITQWSTLRDASMR